MQPQLIEPCGHTTFAAMARVSNMGFAAMARASQTWTFAAMARASQTWVSCEENDICSKNNI
jgi:hypothetical protein